MTDAHFKYLNPSDSSPIGSKVTEIEIFYQEIFGDFKSEIDLSAKKMPNVSMNLKFKLRTERHLVMYQIICTLYLDSRVDRPGENFPKSILMMFYGLENASG